MPEEIFSDRIDDNKESPECNKSLSKMNKSELYEFSKKLVKENQKLQLFVNTSDELHKYNQNTKLDMSKKIKELEKDNVKNVERIEFLEKQYIKLKEDNKLKDGIISLHEQGLSGDDEDKDDLEDKIVEQDVEISNLKLELEEAKSYEKSFNEVKANKDDIEEDLSEEINNLQKEIRELKEEVLKEESISQNYIDEIEELKEKYCTVCLDYDKLAEDHEELKEKDKKSKELFKLMGKWYEDNIIGHLPESEEENEEENEDEEEGFFVPTL